MPRISRIERITRITVHCSLFTVHRLHQGQEAAVDGDLFYAANWGGRPTLSQADDQLLANSTREPFQRVQRDGGVVGIKQAVDLGAAGLQTSGQLALADLYFLHGIL